MGRRPTTRSESSRTLYDKIWDAHLVAELPDGDSIIYVDRHLIHEVTSPQAFERLRETGRKVRAPELALAVADHNVPTVGNRTGGANAALDPQSLTQINALESNCKDFGVPYLEYASPDQGIVHVVGPEQGFVLPGCTVVCGDSHTASHGALGALGIGIGTTEIEHVLATQTLRLRKSGSFEIRLSGVLGQGVTAKDVALMLCRELGPSGGRGLVAHYEGDFIEGLSIEARFTLANMAIEIGSRSALMAPNDAVIQYLQDKPLAPRGKQWSSALAAWSELKSDPGAVFQKRGHFDVSELSPMVTWGTSPHQSVQISSRIPDPAQFAHEERAAAIQAMAYMDVSPGQHLSDLAIQNVFIGSCTNGRLEDLRAAADILNKRRVSPGVRQAIVVPGSGRVKQMGEAEGLDRIFIDAGFEWRSPGCSMCLCMNGDIVPPGERCAATSNRNFVGRQGPQARTHLMSPAMAAAAALRGHITDVREFL